MIISLNETWGRSQLGECDPIHPVILGVQLPRGYKTEKSTKMILKINSRAFDRINPAKILAQLCLSQTAKLLWVGRDYRKTLKDTKVIERKVP